MISAHISDNLMQQFPEVALAYFSATGEAVQPQAENLAATLASEAEEALARNKIELADLATTEPFASWRAAYSRGSLKPSKYQSSIEALTRRSLKAGRLVNTGNVVVDIYNALSVKHLIPMGAYDTTQLPNPRIELRTAESSTDVFSPVGGEAERFPLIDGMPIYASGNEVLCYGFNHRDSAKTACRPSTTEYLFVAEVVTSAMRDRLEPCLSELAEALSTLGFSTTSIVTKDRAGREGAVLPDEQKPGVSS